MYDVPNKPLTQIIFQGKHRFSYHDILQLPNKVMI